MPDLTVTRHDPKEKVENAVEEVWQRVWVPILFEHGEDEPTYMNIPQLKLELHDAYTLYSSLNLLYWELTGGLISKPYTHIRHVIEKAQEHYEGWAAQYMVEELEDLEPRLEPDGGDWSLGWEEGVQQAIAHIKERFPDAFDR